MNKKAQAGPLAAIFLLLIFLINWAIWLGPWIGSVGQQAADVNNMTGVEAFFFYNLNLVVLIAVILGMMGLMYFGLGGQR